MTATATHPDTADPFTLHWPGRQVAAVDLWFPTQQDPCGPDSGQVVTGGWLGDRRVVRHHPDPERYLVWVPTGRPGRELAPRRALHVGLQPSRGVHSCNGCRP